jgi:long-chain acyl-CoA synthetase
MNFPFSTLPGLLLYASQAYRNPAALLFKNGGRWCPIGSEEMAESVRQAGEQLIALGLRPGDRVGIASDSSPFWLMADLAALGAGAVTVPLFPNAAPDVVRHQILDSGMRFLFVENEELREAFSPFTGSVQHVLVLSSRRLQKLAPSDWAAGEGTVELGAWDQRVAALKPGNTATLIYTSGSTGLPKGVELTHDNIVSQVQAARDCFPLDAGKDRALSFLPLSHIFERMVAYYYLASGVSLAFAEDSKQAGFNLREVRPTVMTVVPRFLEKVHARVLELADSAGGIAHTLAVAAMKRATEKEEGAPRTWKDAVYERLVFRKIRAQMGGRLRFLISGSAALDPRLAKFFGNLGVPVYEGYGLTESSPVLTANFPGSSRMGTVGRPFPGVELRIAPDGEILARGPNIMKGYYGQPEATAETIDAEGWLRTGDLGSFDGDGFLRVTGRKKELFKTANGKYVAPLPIEQALAAHKLIESALVVAEGRRFVSAVIFPDFEALIQLKKEIVIPEAGGSMLNSGTIQARFRDAVNAVNHGLNAWEQIRRFYVAEAPPTIEGGEMTPTLKLRRHAIEAKYRRKIEAMYEE